ncbi:MAG: hypothetical protein N2595_05590 [bacterium]|nr:hypothetical protein [bacterium]
MRRGTDAAINRLAERIRAEQARVVERIAAELWFAEELAVREKRRGDEWRRLIARAREVVSEATAKTLEQAVREAEGVLAPLQGAAKAFTIRCVGHAHIDMNWLWSWPETVAITCDTFETVLGLMEEFGDFCFSQSQASVYAIAAEYRPELLERIKARVREGRWEVTAVHWVEGDKNMVHGESLARHLLYTRRYIKELLGVGAEEARLDWECDVFGHAQTLPTILVLGGVQRYYLCRSGVTERPPVFWWEGPDGSRVLVVRELTMYNDHLSPHIAEGMLRFYDLTGMREWMEVYGVGDHGGGPTRRDIVRAHEMNEWPVFPRVVLGTASEFYEQLEERGEEWPVVKGELNAVFAGCYTSQGQIKRMNRLGEHYCLEAESAGVMAERAVGRTYPREGVRSAWINVLFGHFHDILPGSGVRWTREYQSGLFQRTAALTQEIKTQSYRAIAAAVDTSFARESVEGDRDSRAYGAGVGRGAMEGGLAGVSWVHGGGRPVVVFNPVSWRRREVVQATVWDDGREGDTSGGYVVRFSDGKVEAAQVLREGEYWGHKFREVAFPIEVGGFGYTAVSIEEGSGEAREKHVRVYEGAGRFDAEMGGTPVLENEWLRVRMDVKSGGVSELYDKVGRVNVVAEGEAFGVLEFGQERARSMSAWVMGEVSKWERVGEVMSMGVTQRGPHVASVETRVRVGSSVVTLTYTLKAGSKMLEIGVETLWLERGDAARGTPVLRMRFPCAIKEARARYEVPFGWIERKERAGEEVSAVRWAQVMGWQGRRRVGCVVMNDCKHGYALKEGTLTLTLLRSSYEPDPVPEIRDHVMRVGVMLVGGEVGQSTVIREGAAFNHALQVVNTDRHKGRLRPAAVGIEVEPGNVVVSSVRKAQEGEGFVVHAYETEGKRTRARVMLRSDLFGRVRKVTEVDFLERVAEYGKVRRVGNGFEVDLRAFGIACVKIE